MSIQPITAALPSLPDITTVNPALPAPAADPAAGAAFGNALTQGLERLQGMHTATDEMAVKAATGDLADVHDYMVASTQTSVATELTVAVRNKAVEAFTEIMRMQV